MRLAYLMRTKGRALRWQMCAHTHTVWTHTQTHDTHTHLNETVKSILIGLRSVLFLYHWRGFVRTHLRLTEQPHLTLLNRPLSQETTGMRLYILIHHLMYQAIRTKLCCGSLWVCSTSCTQSLLVRIHSMAQEMTLKTWPSLGQLHFAHNDSAVWYLSCLMP